MLKLGVVRWKGRCTKHPSYDPYIDGLGGIRGGCQRCELLLEIQVQHERLVRLIREYGTRPDERQKRQDSEADRQMSLLDLV